ncbi:MAG: class I SAM-dependent methyltransferase [Pyrinomonadaceae bacterium]
MSDETTEIEVARARVREIATEFADKGDATGWFDALYRESAGDPSKIPWADLEPNRFLKEWSANTNLRGEGRKALIVGCGLGDDARYLYDLDFKVTAFDISPAAIEWAKKLHKDTDIQFETADLFDPPSDWLGEFDFVVEVYTIQPLPRVLRPKVIDAISSFVCGGGKLVVVTRGREDGEEPAELPWPLSRADLSRFEDKGLVQTDFVEIPADDDVPAPRFVVEYTRPL